jgi:hypothetical protein
VAYWSFDNCDAKDDSGNGHDGEIKGNLECVVGVKGKAFKFDGKSSIITPLRLNGIPENQNITIVVWGKTEKFEKERAYPFITNFNIGDSSKSVYIGSDRIGITTGFSGYYGDGYCYEYVPIIINGEEVNWGDCEGKTKQYSIEDFGSKPLEDFQNWHMYALSYDNNTERIYIDGELVAELDIGGNAIGGNSPAPAYSYRDDSVYDRRLRIGGLNNAFGYSISSVEHTYLKGTVDEIRIYNRALTEDEIKALYDQENQ